MRIDFTKKQRSAGLDIADHTIEVVEVEKRGNDIEVVSSGRIKLSPGVVERGMIKNKEKLAWTLREVLKNAKPRPIEPENIIFGLPESLLYTHVIEIAKLSYDRLVKSKDKLNERIEKEILKSVPLASESLAYCYRVLEETVLKKGGKSVEILTLSADKNEISSWRGFFSEMNWRIEEFDADILAVRRSLVHNSMSRSTNFMVVDIGEVRTAISIFDDNVRLRYSHSFPVAGDAMRDEVAAALNVPKKKAENLKVEIGLSDPEGKVFSALVKVLEKISREIESSLQYYRKKTGKDVREAVFVGGSSRLIGLTQYFGANF